MKTGSVLIVVLGLLAILAIVGITFVTMANLDRSTSDNFALMTQFDLARDAAVDYVCNAMVQDLWEVDSTSHRYYTSATGTGECRLLTCANTSAMATVDQQLITNEPWDAPGTWDPWLATNAESLDPTWYSSASFRPSFAEPAPNALPYGIPAWGIATPTNSTYRVNNMGLPDATGKVNTYSPGMGVWSPRLSFPYETGVIRVSVTVQDHCGMVNLNAHFGGAKMMLTPASAYDDTMLDAQGNGYFVSDVWVGLGGLGFDIKSLLQGSGTRPGLWAGGGAGAGSVFRPINWQQMASVVENPAGYQFPPAPAIGQHEHPFTLEEEYELRRPLGTAYTSRLETFNQGLVCSPGQFSQNAAIKRLSCTTISWTSEVRGDKYAFFLPRGDHVTGVYTNRWTSRKTDLNYDEPGTIFAALAEGLVFDSTDTAGPMTMRYRQFAANIAGFRDGRIGDPPRWSGSIQGPNNMTAAGRQPVISQIFVDPVTTSWNDGGNPSKTYTVYKLKVDVVSPWPNDCAAQDRGAGLTVDGYTLVVPGATKDGRPPAADERRDLGDISPLRENQVETKTFSFYLLPSETLMSKFKKVTLEYGGLVVDLWDASTSDLQGSPTVPHVYRPTFWEDDKRGPADASPVRAVYFGKWKDGANEHIGSPTPQVLQDTSQIAVRFPRASLPAVSGNGDWTSNLPPRAQAPPRGVQSASPSTAFKSFARVGDLDQVLMFETDPTGSTGNWVQPWVKTVADTPATEEWKIKFDWSRREDGSPSDYFSDTVDYQSGRASRRNASNILSVSGPWADRLDNDGDGCCDDRKPSGVTMEPDVGKVNGQTTGQSGGRFGGPELRVAGKINLNTATTDTLTALEKGLGINGLASAAKNERIAGRPIKSVASLLEKIAAPGAIGARGTMEANNIGYVLLSNIATVRSDTFSIYGTIQYIDAGAMSRATTAADSIRAVRRTRRFWALVDRSPSLAYAPTGPLGSMNTTDGGKTVDFIRPRVLNFQWMD